MLTMFLGLILVALIIGLTIFLVPMGKDLWGDSDAKLMVVGMGVMLVPVAVLGCAKYREKP